MPFAIIPSFDNRYTQLTPYSFNHLPHHTHHSGNFFACTILFYIYYCRIAGNSAGLPLEQLLGTAWFWGDKILISLMAMVITVPFDSKCVFVTLAPPVPTP